MFYFQCVVSNGHTSTLAIVKGKCKYHRNNKSERLSKKNRNKDEQFWPGKGWYLTE